MRSPLTILILFFCTISMAEDHFDKPETVARGFIASYKAWNDRAFGRTGWGKTPNISELNIATKEYGELIKKYCSPNVKPQLVAYGSESMHSPSDRTVKITTNGSSAVVVIAHPNSLGTERLSEFHLSYIKGKWLIESVLAVLDDGKYELL